FLFQRVHDGAHALLAQDLQILKAAGLGAVGRYLGRFQIFSVHIKEKIVARLDALIDGGEIDTECAELRPGRIRVGCQRGRHQQAGGKKGGHQAHDRLLKESHFALGFAGFAPGFGGGGNSTTSPPVSFSMVRPGVTRWPLRPEMTEIAATLPGTRMDLSPSRMATMAALGSAVKLTWPLQPPWRGARPVQVGPSVPTLPRNSRVSVPASLPVTAP